MLPWLTGEHGNPSSAHGFGRKARAAVETAREQVARLLGARPEDVVFNGSGTEGNNTVILDRGAARASGAADESAPGHIVFAAFEHPSVGAAVARLEEQGVQSTRVAPGADGLIAPAAVEAALRENTRLVCVMLANNELGTLQPVAELAALCRERALPEGGIPVLCDAVQAVGKVPVRVEELGVDYLTLGGHKFHGPLGVGALWIRPGHRVRSLLLGAAQERGRRASTENVPGIVALGAAAELAHRELDQRAAFLRELRDRFEAGLVAIPDAVVHCAGSPRLPHTCHVAFLGVVGQELMMALDEAGMAVSTGAACGSGSPKPSATLLAMGMDADEAIASLRISFGRTNTTDEIDRLLAALAAQVERLRRRPVPLFR
jgi:cysteine desulfurase